MRDDELTPEEHTRMNNTRHCPDCVVGVLRRGPCGGCSVNVKCDNAECRHEFSVALLQGTVAFASRIDRDAPGLYGNAPLFPDPGSIEHYYETMDLCRAADDAIRRGYLRTASVTAFVLFLVLWVWFHYTR